MNNTTHIALSSTPHCPKLRAKGEKFAERLKLPYIEYPLEASENTLFLLVTEQGLTLVRYIIHNKKKEKYKIQQLAFVDFLHGKQGYRLAHNCTIQQPLAKAVGIKKGVRPQIIDATAGLGGDSFVFASLGCEVLLLERNPIIATLLTDGIQRARKSQKIGKIIERMQFIQENSIDFFTAIHGEERKKIEDCTIYLDPMYPHTNSHAEKKIAMRILRQVVGDDNDAENLFAAAEKSFSKRIVIKRPRLAPVISSSVTGKTPNYTVPGKSCRYDIYLQK